MSVPSTIKDFTVLPILYKSSSSSKRTEHFLYLREHTSKPQKFGREQDPQNASKREEWETYPNGRTLFVVNVPPDSTERELRLFFQPCGHVERVILRNDGQSGSGLVPLDGENYDSDDSDEDEDGDENEERSQQNLEKDAPSHEKGKDKKIKTKTKTKAVKDPPKVIPLPSDISEIPLRSYQPTGSTAYIIFAELGAVSNALKLRNMTDDERLWLLGNKFLSQVTVAVAPYGLAHYVALHGAERPPLDAVKKHADSYIEVYDYNKNISSRRAASKYKKGEAIVDEDGFTLVVRGGAYGQSVGGGVGVASKMFTQEMEGDSVSNLTSKRKKKKKKHEKEDFYKFQIHEKRRQELIELKNNFEKDKEKISAKRTRYKPY